MELSMRAHCSPPQICLDLVLDFLQLHGKDLQNKCFTTRLKMSLGQVFGITPVFPAANGE